MEEGAGESGNQKLRLCELSLRDIERLQAIAMTLDWVWSVDWDEHDLQNLPGTRENVGGDWMASLMHNGLIETWTRNVG